MYRILPTETLVSLITTFKQWGGLIDYVQIGEEKAFLSEHSSERHKCAAIFTAQAVTDSHVRYRCERFREHETEMKKIWPWLTEDTTYHVDLRKGTGIRPEEAQGYQITPSEFFAPPIVWVGRKEVQKLPSWWDADAFVAALERDHDDGCFISTGSYPYAFRETPYGLSYQAPSSVSYIDQEQEESEINAGRPSERAIDDLFEAINQQLFGETLDALTIYRWPTHWIDFFNFDHDAGWWGGYLWTVFNARTNIFAGIAASAIDVDVDFYRYFDDRNRLLP